MKWNSVAQTASRWWSAPARFSNAPLSLLRKAVLQQYAAASNAWLHHHSPVGIRAQLDADLGGLPPR
jgi:hypothetical protein